MQRRTWSQLWVTMLLCLLPLILWAQSEKRVTVELKDAPITEAFDQLFRAAGENFMLLPTAPTERRLTMRLTDVPFEKVLNFLCDLAGLKWERKDSVYVIGPKQPIVGVRAIGGAFTQPTVPPQVAQPTFGPPAGPMPGQLMPPAMGPSQTPLGFPPIGGPMGSDLVIHSVVAMFCPGCKTIIRHECPKCKNLMAWEWKFCPFDGTKLPPPPQNCPKCGRPLPKPIHLPPPAGHEQKPKPPKEK